MGNLERDVVSPLLQAFPDAMAIYGFGSQFMGHADAQSDLDLAVLVPGYADPRKLWEASESLANLTGLEVDLLDFRAATTVMQAQVLHHGKRLWAADQQADFYELFVLNEKIRFDESRAALLADIKKRGTVYGR